MVDVPTNERNEGTQVLYFPSTINFEESEKRRGSRIERPRLVGK